MVPPYVGPALVRLLSLHFFIGSKISFQSDYRGELASLLEDGWWAISDSNRGSTGYEPAALTAKLIAHDWCR